VIDEDLAVFFADWGEEATLDGAALVVIYGAPGAALLGGAGMSADKPRALAQAADVPARATAPDADPVLVFATVTAVRPLKRWYVREQLPDGTGLTTLVLSKHPDQS
jgi:hypothetical protein